MPHFYSYKGKICYAKWWKVKLLAWFALQSGIFHEVQFSLSYLNFFNLIGGSITPTLSDFEHPLWNDIKLIIDHLLYKEMFLFVNFFKGIIAILIFQWILDIGTMLHCAWIGKHWRELFLSWRLARNGPICLKNVIHQENESCVNKGRRKVCDVVIVKKKRSHPIL